MKTRKANWWLLYATVPLMIIALVIESRMTYTQTTHQVAEIGIVIVAFGLMALWVQANRAAVEREESEITYSSAELPATQAYVVDLSELSRAKVEDIQASVLAGAPDPHHVRYN